MPGCKERRRTSSDGERESPKRIRQGGGVEKVRVIPMTEKWRKREIMKGIKSVRMSRSCRLLKQLGEIPDILLNVVRIF